MAEGPPFLAADFIILTHRIAFVPPAAKAGAHTMAPADSVLEPAPIRFKRRLLG